MSPIQATEYNPGKPLERYSAERRRRGTAAEASAYTGAGSLAAGAGAMVGNAKIAGTNTGQAALTRAQGHLNLIKAPGGPQLERVKTAGKYAAKHKGRTSAAIAGLGVAATGLGVVGRMRADETTGISQGIGRIKAGESYTGTQNRVLSKSWGVRAARFAAMNSDERALNPKMRATLAFANKHAGPIGTGAVGAAGGTALLASAKSGNNRIEGARQLRARAAAQAKVAKGSTKAITSGIRVPGKNYTGTIPKTADGRVGGTFTDHGKPPPKADSDTRHVHQPGDPGYHGVNQRHYGNRWADIAHKMNLRNIDRREDGLRGRKLVKIAAVTAAGATALTPVYNAGYRMQERQAKAKMAKGLKNPWRIHSGKPTWSATDFGIRQAPKNGKVHDVSGMGHGPWDKIKKPPMERLGAAHPDPGDFAAGDKPVRQAIYIGAGVGAVPLTIGTAKARKRAATAQKAARAQSRGRVTPTPVTKGITAPPIATVRATPNATAAKLTAGKAKISPQKKDLRNWGIALGGGSLVGGKVVHHNTKEKKNKTTAGAVAGGLAGQGLYQAPAYATNNYIRPRLGSNLSDADRTAIRNGTMKRPAHLIEGYEAAKPHKKRKSEARAHLAAHANKDGSPNYKRAFRNQPRNVPYHPATRIMAHTHGGKTGQALGTAATLGGAAVGAKIMRAGPTEKVKKGLYQQETRPSMLNYTKLGVGSALAAWGLGRSGMLGAALGRGVKMATARGNTNALDALRMAQATQGLLARSTAPGERGLRQIRSLNTAINRVPARLRPEIAAASGIYLMGSSHPLNRSHYRQVPSYGRPF